MNEELSCVVEKEKGQNSAALTAVFCAVEVKSIFQADGRQFLFEKR